ncbi:MAG: histidine kinase [Actinomycetota bacterium]
MRRRVRRRTNIDDLAETLGTLNGLSAGLRHGLDEEAALRIARSTQTLLECRAVAVTSEQTVLAEVGHSPPWQAQVEQHAALVLERRRGPKPTLYSMSLPPGQSEEVAVAVLSSDGVPIGTIHAMAGEAGLNMRALGELAELVGYQLQLAEVEQSRARAAEAELQALRAQLSPHFLHNSLTAIAGLINTDPARARSAVAKFAEFLRASFRDQTDLTTVSEELRLVELYLELAQVRFGDRFDVLLNIAPEALPVSVPVLSIQTLVENAIGHGLEAKSGRGSLWIIADDAGPEVNITVEDDGVGVDPELLRRALAGTDTTTHVGILAVDARLRSTFGPEYGLIIGTATNKGTKVTMRLPKSRRHRR